ncbi:MAG TPA: hypothetical protein VHY80_01850, partial [Stellaceae bacterium]|nr:hypothetical protein [Stellaceae bacterium]
MAAKFGMNRAPPVLEGLTIPPLDLQTTRFRGARQADGEGQLSKALRARLALPWLALARRGKAAHEV